MKKKHSIQGFTMAELLIVVAIITVLAGVSFIAVQNHQKSMAQLDVNAMAKEIYFAAQNHLTVAESQGYPTTGTKGENYFGTPTAARASDATNADIYYFTVSGSDGFTDGDALELMLPFGSIDETIRSRGNYIIRYQPSPARVLDVFYGDPNGRYPENPADYLNSSNFEPLFSTYTTKVIGHYGDADAKERGVLLNEPLITVQNAECLTVHVDTTRVNQDKDGNPILPDKGTFTVKLFVKGKTSQAVAAIPMDNNRVTDNSDGTYDVVLDDVTQGYNKNYNDGYHFVNINQKPGAIGSSIDVEKTFIPGEDIIIYAVAYSTDTLANIVQSNEETTNSLFADVVEDANKNKVALISNFRHLENLDKRVSGLDTAIPTGAKMTTDLIWQDNKSIFTNASIYQMDKDTTGTGAGCYLPVNLDYPLVFDGFYTTQSGKKACHTITGVKVGAKGAAYSGDGGLFGKTTEALNVSNLALVDFDIHATGNAGALAGSLAQGGTVSNVVAYNTDAFENAAGGAATIASTGSDTSAGSAGGLIGSMTNASLDRCAAAVIVESAGKNAGGLVGDAFGTGTVTNSYSGGHTVNAAAPEGYAYDGDKLNVTSASGSAGGLIGNSGQVEISNCYSTCSVKGAVAGGLVGDAGSIVEDSYCTGLVRGASATATVGAFAGKLTVDPENCHYLEIMNPIDDAVTYMPPVSGKTMEDYGEGALSPFDATATAYNEFVGDGDLAAALPYSVALKDFGEYPLRPLSGVNATASATAPADFVATHYGDWPMPEALVVNTK